MVGSCVQVQCTLKPRGRKKSHAHGSNLNSCLVVCQSEAGLIMYIAPCVKRRRMSQILVFNDASAILEIMQNVSTLQEFTACCLTRLDGRYTMTFN